MADKPSDLVRGTPDMLILKTLAFQCMHGYGIAVRLEQTSGEQRCYREQPAGYLYRLAAPLSFHPSAALRYE